MPIRKKTKFGNQTAAKADIVPLTENEVDMVVNKTYNELKANPTPKCSPIPPRTFLEDSDTPINVIIKAANGIAYRLKYSSSKPWIFPTPRLSWRWI